MFNPPSSISDDIVFETCRQFFDGQPVEDTKKWLKGATGKDVSREFVYRLVRQGLHRGFIRLNVPEEIDLSRELRHRFPHTDITVLNVRAESVVDGVASKGADLVMAKIREIGDPQWAKRDTAYLERFKGKPGSKKPVARIGFGAGATTRSFALQLAKNLREVKYPKTLPALEFHALTAGFPFRLDVPISSPMTLFSYFDDLRDLDIQISYVGLFAPGMVKSEEYKNLKDFESILRSFEKARELDIIVASLSRGQDEHSLFKQLLDEDDRENSKKLRRDGWVGDFLWRPYSNTSPLDTETSVRAVTPFELTELVTFCAMPGKHVVCLASPCNVCKQDKADALLPLLRTPKLRAFNHVIMDMKTANHVLKLDRETA